MKLSDFELDVMQLFWEGGERSSPQIYNAIKKDKDVAYTTVKTIVDRLEEKGAIERVGQNGRSIVYAPTVTQASMTESLLPHFLRRFFGGNPRALITQLIQAESLDKKDFDYLQEVLDKHKHLEQEEDGDLNNQKDTDKSNA